MGLHLVKCWICVWKHPIRVHRTLFYGTEGPGLAFHEHMYYTNQNKEKSPLVNPRTEKARGVDLRVPESRVYPEKEPEIVGIPRKLACVHTICVQV